MSTSRQASHAGTWYTDDQNELRDALNEWLQVASHGSEDEQLSSGSARAIIAPHAGYSYSGPTAAYAYKFLKPLMDSPRRVFILGPSHHYYLETCALSKMEQYETPLGSLKIDTEIIAELKSKGPFDDMTKEDDEAEHSIEMQLPYIAHMLAGTDCTIVPILVGNLSPANERLFGEILAPYFAQPNNFFIISSDFCHWGSRFRFQHYDTSKGEIWESIEALDKTGMKLIQDQNTKGFTEYLQKYGNTICGRHPIAVMLNSIDVLREESRKRHHLEFTHYAQSSKCKGMSDSSVSYAAAAVVQQ